MTHDAPEPETLEQLVADRVGAGRDMTWRQFEDRAVDEESGHRPSRDTLWKIGTGKPVKVDRRVVGAVAAGLRLPLRRVQAAAAYQFFGLVTSDVDGGTVLHAPEASPGGPRVRDVLRGREGADE